MKYVVLIFLSIVLTNFSLLAENPRPNIIWIYGEDTSPNFGYHGETLIQTPNVDKLAKEGVVFKRAYVTSPVFSANRSALITGMFQTSTGAHNRRSSRGPNKIYLPEKIKTIPEYFREAGYYVSNQFLQNDNDWDRKGKEDYNFLYKTDELYDGLDWKGKDEDQPFFGQIHLVGGKKRQVHLNTMVDPDNVVLPPHYPNDPIRREDWARYLNSVKNLDNKVGIIFDRLREENLLENTVVFFMADHGISHARGKQFCYEEGAHIPMVILWSDHDYQLVEKLHVSKFNLWDYASRSYFMVKDQRNLQAAGQRCYQPVCLMDIYPTVAGMAGLKLPDKRISGRVLFSLLKDPAGEWSAPAHTTFKTADSHMIRDHRFKLIRYEGEDSEIELYDLKYDGEEYYNLANVPGYEPMLKRMKSLMEIAIQNGKFEEE